MSVTPLEAYKQLMYCRNFEVLVIQTIGRAVDEPWMEKGGFKVRGTLAPGGGRNEPKTELEGGNFNKFCMYAKV